MSFDFHDISYAQGLYDMDSDKSPVVFMKMSGYYYGSKTPYYDVQAARNYNNAIRLGKVPGLYHYAGGADPVAEADFFVGACSPLAEGDIYILDYELTGEMNPPADPVSWCLAFVNRVHERTGTWPLFYTYGSMLAEHDFTPVLENCALWVANYAVSPDNTVPTKGHPYIIHQYQGSPIDTNRSFVDLKTLKKYGYKVSQETTPVETPPAPTPETPVETPVETTPEAPDDTTDDDDIDWPSPIEDEPTEVNTPEEVDSIKKIAAVALRAFHAFWQSFIAVFAVTSTGILASLVGVHTFSELKSFAVSVVVAVIAAAISAVKNLIKTPQEAK